MKKVIYVVMVLCMIATMFSLPAAEVGAQTVSLSAAKSLDSIISTAEANMLAKSLPIYVTRVDRELYPSIATDGVDYVALHKERVETVESEIAVISPTITVRKMSGPEIADQLSNPIFRTALKRGKEAIDAGYQVENVNIILPNQEEVSTTSSGCPVTQNSVYWGWGYGHHFRYYWITTTVYSNQVTISNKPSTWPQIRQALFKVLVNRILDYATNQAWSVMADMNSVIGAISPINYYFSNQHEFIKGYSAGTWYSREICIEDTRNRMPGYDYYPWGSAERVEHVSHISCKAKVSESDGGIYAHWSYTTPMVISKSVNYDNCFSSPKVAKC